MSSNVIVALDFHDKKTAVNFVDSLDPQLCRLKVGKELFTSCGPEIVNLMVSKGYDVFLDLKFHDIPNTVARACKAAAELGVWMLNVHSMGGRAMMEAARDALSARDAPLLIAVTLLTSSDQADLSDLGINKTPEEFVSHMAKMAQQAGLDGVVCSAKEALALRLVCGNDFKLVTPGIRLQDKSDDDQKRIVTPAQAVKNGSDFLVIGRPVTESSDPCRTLRTILSDIA